MIYFDSDMSKSTNMVVYIDWKTLIYIFACWKCRTQFMLPKEKSVTFTGACANEIIPSINCSFVYKAKEVMLEYTLHTSFLYKSSKTIWINLLTSKVCWKSFFFQSSFIIVFYRPEIILLSFFKQNILNYQGQGLKLHWKDIECMPLKE